MFLIFLYRDAALSFIRIICAIDGSVIAAKLSGKLKAVFQAIGIFFVLFIVLCHALNIGCMPQKVWGMHPGFWTMLFPAIFTVLSFFDYFFPSLPILKKMASKGKKND
jgi:CDP-diacylglycerol--glycerol-3-phosphate 3-phosphatidyltransferase